MKGSNWTTRLKETYTRALNAYSKGTSMNSAFTADDVKFLAGIGIKPITVWDNVEDFHNCGEPTWEIFLLNVAIQRFHMYIMQGGKRDGLKPITAADLPTKTEAFEGVAWLPRIVRKAHGFLHGTLGDDIMYNCGGDRAFLKKYDIAAPDFLRTMWALEYDLAKVKNWLENNE